MALSLVSNFAANVAHRNLAQTNSEATASLAKLSSGTRVVSAKDDAASLAIGSRISSEVAALKQASVNAGQAGSMLQIADGAMSKNQDILTRMKTLAVQSASDQNSATERSMLDTEYQALLSEIDRIAENTQFNGQSLVNGSSGTETTLNSVASADDNLVQAADGFAAINFDSDVGDNAFSVAFDSSSNVLTVTNLTNGTSQGVNVGGDAIGVNETQDVKFSELGVSITLNSAFDKTSDIQPSGSFTAGTGDGAISDAGVKITSASAAGGQDVTDFTMTIGTTAGNTAAAAELVIGDYSATGVDLTETGVTTATFTNSEGDSFTLEFVVTEAFTDPAVAAMDNTLDIEGIGAMVFAEATSSTTTDFTYRVGTGTGASDSMSFSVDSINATALGVGGTSIDGADSTNSDAAIAAISGAIDTLNTSRANIGSAQNRLEFASANLATTIENQESARSQLLDLDVASEMTQFTSKQVLMQAGVSMLAQANQMPQQLTRLFG